MTRQKSFKRRVRARMEKTGERYTVAREQLIAKSSRAEPSEPPADSGRATVGMQERFSDELLAERTGRTWDRWFAALDEWGATERRHWEIASWLREEHGVAGWWAQSITVGYEQARGMRAPGERSGGGFSATASKTVDVPVERLFAAFADDDERRRWAPDTPLTLRRATPGKSIRFDWDDGSTRVVAGFDVKGAAKSTVGLEHERLPDAAEADRLKAYWRERLAALKEVLES
jgi:hypothetical protein